MLKTGIAGLGWWGKELVRAVSDKSDVIAFVQAVDLNPDNVRSFASAHNIELCESFETLLKSEDIEAIVLATPHSQHVEQIIACAEAGKHVFSEKPLALNLKEAKRAVDAVHHHNIIFGLGTDRRFLPAIMDLKAMMENGELGRILQVEVQYSNDNMSKGVTGSWRKLPSEAPGAGMTGPGLHALDALVNLAGPVAKVSGNLRQPFGSEEPLDAISLRLEFENGITGLHGCVRGCPRFFRVAAFGTGGWAEVRDFNELHYHKSDEKRSAKFYEPGRATQQTLETFANAVLHRQSFPVSTDSMLHTVAAFETVIRSFETEAIIEVPSL